MALTPASIFESDATGANETISLQPASTDVTIASAVYSGQVVQVAGDRKSLSFTVAQGVHPLVIPLVSPDPEDEEVDLAQDSGPLASVVVSQHSGVSTLLIQGK